MKNTFSYPIPSRTYIENGGNIIQAKIITEFPAGPILSVIRRDNNTLFLKPPAPDEPEIKSHIDLCYVLAEVII